MSETGVSIKLNRREIAELLKSPEFAAVVNAAARDIAANAGTGAEVVEYTTDRRAATVRVPADRQAKDGALTKAAAALGIPVKLR
ncbi:hypothetical protein G4X40_18560 [Rhodococcus sp. D2-41]|uniref:hypothetical protein n=1 Tax=Speluncibacter jeojiensis TaxID=2710754 RepID=UPI00240FB0D8|nr:hypothetical protein [Rhodococcus sp. D2-41]MDG3012148.1 hypothetical protein [Rhodococcus sp. D2-41]